MSNTTHNKNAVCCSDQLCVAARRVEKLPRIISSGDAVWLKDGSRVTVATVGLVPSTETSVIVSKRTDGSVYVLSPEDVDWSRVRADIAALDAETR